MARKKKPPKRVKKKSRREKLRSALVQVPLMVAVLGVAGALVMAMLFALFTLDQDSMSGGFSVLGPGALYAVLYGLAAGVAAALMFGLVYLFIDRKEAVSISLSVGVVLGLVVFCTYGLYAIFMASLRISPWGAYIGAALGGLVGVPSGLAMAWSDEPVRVTKATRRKRSADAAEVAIWVADDIDIDADTDADAD